MYNLVTYDIYTHTHQTIAKIQRVNISIPLKVSLCPFCNLHRSAPQSLGSHCSTSVIREEVVFPGPVRIWNRVACTSSCGCLRPRFEREHSYSESHPCWGIKSHSCSLLSTAPWSGYSAVTLSWHLLTDSGVSSSLEATVNLTNKGAVMIQGMGLWHHGRKAFWEGDMWAAEEGNHRAGGEPSRRAFPAEGSPTMKAPRQQCAWWSQRSLLCAFQRLLIWKNEHPGKKFFGEAEGIR